AQLQKKLSRPTAHLFSSIFLGNKYARKKDIEPLKEHFTTWGVTHYLARSGLHMVIFTITWHTLLTFIPLAFALKEALLIALVIIYALLSWTTISFTRALLLFLIHRLCSLLRLQTDLLYLLTLVALAILFDNPLQLFFLDFQLSFGLTFALAYFGQLQTYYRHSRHKTIASA
ncbi:MAG TPA: ComEC/Rec2 family competence protein, partial [Candidatus Limnocylindria bacterium]|nr:ComEC/Rec2 family competence protein [Candidatus Limnocylindria bacterium]